MKIFLAVHIVYSFTNESLPSAELEYPKLALCVSNLASGIHTLHSFPHFSLISLPASTAADTHKDI